MANFQLPFLLTPLFKERVWGRKRLLPFFPDVSTRDTELIGEAWFTSNQNLTSSGISLGEVLTAHPGVLGTAADPQNPGICPLLVKLLFTSERLSVQVHPDDVYAKAHHKSLGKTEAWYVVDAEPYAEIALGLKKPLSAHLFQQAIPSGRIEKLLAWHKIHPGDTVLVPAGTIHAIGAGLIVCEVQENSDITYRLWDYGRAARELHIQHGTAVSKREPYEFHPHSTPITPGRDALTKSDYFRMERLRPNLRISIGTNLPYYLLFLCVRGNDAGKFWFVPAHGDEFELVSPGSEWVLAYKSSKTSDGISVE